MPVLSPFPAPHPSDVLHPGIGINPNPGPGGARRSQLRAVSPVGTSRFEAPFEPPPVVHVVRSNPASTAASPTTPSRPESHWIHYDGKRAAATTAHDSLFSTMDDAATTHQTSSEYARSPRSPRGPAFAGTGGPDEWFARFHADDITDGTLSDSCPDRDTIAAVEDMPVFNAEGRGFRFGSLVDPSTATHQRQLIIFVRHFYCGACQAYLMAMTESITMREYFSIPVPTSIIVIGCGKPDLIPHYKSLTKCPFPMFADPSRSLFKKLGMHVSLNIGTERPDYMKDISTVSWAAGQFKTVGTSLMDTNGIRKRDVLRGGNPLQVGGEFLFEDGRVIWCHRMKNFRNHAEVKVLRRLLELDV